MDNIKKFEGFLDRMQELLDEAKKQGHIIVRVEDLEKAFPELKESEDESICRKLIAFLKQCKAVYGDGFKQFGLDIEDAIALLEKQANHANFCNKIQIGDKVTRNEDGVLVNLSQLNRVAKKLGEQKPQRMISAEAKETLYGKTAWSEEDKNVLEDIEEAIINYWHGDTQDILLDWLKSLRPQSRWKPSEEQINYFSKHIEYERKWNSYHALNVLSELLEQLKKLKG